MKLKEAAAGLPTTYERMKARYDLLKKETAARTAKMWALAGSEALININGSAAVSLGICQSIKEFKNNYYFAMNKLEKIHDLDSAKVGKVIVYSYPSTKQEVFFVPAGKAQAERLSAETIKLAKEYRKMRKELLPLKRALVGANVPRVKPRGLNVEQNAEAQYIANTKLMKRVLEHAWTLKRMLFKIAGNNNIAHSNEKRDPGYLPGLEKPMEWIGMDRLPRTPGLREDYWEMKRGVVITSSNVIARHQDAIERYREYAERLNQLVKQCKYLQNVAQQQKINTDQELARKYV